MIIRESYLEKIRPFIGKDIIKVLTGIRRAGKSMLLEQIRDEISSPNTVYDVVVFIVGDLLQGFLDPHGLVGVVGDLRP